MALLKIRTFASPTPSKSIAVQNGIFDVAAGKLKPFTKYDFITNKLQVSYVEGAKSEPWLKFIDQVCPDDKELLQQWSGYLLIKGYPFHAIMWLFGPTGRNGKGTWARTVESILGADNYSAVSIDQFDGKHPFAVFNLHDSLFNICSEPRADRNLSIEMLQMLTGMDAVDAERKGIQEPFKFFNGAKMTVMGNKFPKVINPTNAFWDRLKLIKFPFTFTGANQIQDIEKTWLDDPIQRAGVFNWMVKGAQKLLASRSWVTTKTQQEVIIQFKRASDTIGAFILECFEYDAKAIVSHEEVSKCYKEYCEDIEAPAESSTALNARLRDTPKIKDTWARLGIDKKNTKVWKGIKLRALPESDIESDDNSEETSDNQATLINATDASSLTDFSLQNNSSENNKDLDLAQKSVASVASVASQGTVSDDKVNDGKALHFKRLGPYERHDCDVCKVIAAEFQQAESFFCPSCFESGRIFALMDGITFVEDIDGERF